METATVEDGLGYLFGPAHDTEHVVAQREARWGYFTLNAYLYLKERLAYLPEVHERFSEWVAEQEAANPYSKVARYPLVAAETYVVEVLGVPERDVTVVNTYDAPDSFLDDILQYVQWTDADTGQTFVLLQRHRGGDIRGNYSDAVPFEVVVDPTSFCADSDTVEAYCSVGHGFDIRANEVYSVEDDRYLDASNDADALVATAPGQEGPDYLCPVCRASGQYVPLQCAWGYPCY